MKCVVAADAAGAGAAAAHWIASVLREAVATRGTASLAISGGGTPVPMFEALARIHLPWARLRVVQVDERIVPAGDLRRNSRLQRATLVERGPLAAQQFLAMPVEAGDLPAAAAAYAKLVGRIDVVHLGLGEDGHTASLLPGDPLLAEEERRVAISGAYQGTQRMTLTLPAINSAHCIVWLITGASKCGPLRELLAQQGDAPALQVRREAAVVFADAAAAGDDDGNTA